MSVRVVTLTVTLAHSLVLTVLGLLSTDIFARKRETARSLSSWVLISLELTKYVG